MKKIILQSGTYAVDDILQGFDIIEKSSSNVAFVGTCLITHQMYVQFKNGSGYMYSEVDYDTLSAVPTVDSIGRFISSHVVKKFASEKMENALIVSLPPSHEEQAVSRLNRKSQPVEVETLVYDPLKGLNFKSFGDFLDEKVNAAIIIDDPLHPANIKPEDVGEFHTRYADTLAKRHGMDLDNKEPEF